MTRNVLPLGCLAVDKPPIIFIPHPHIYPELCHLTKLTRRALSFSKWNESRIHHETNLRCHLASVMKIIKWKMTSAASTGWWVMEEGGGVCPVGGLAGGWNQSQKPRLGFSGRRRTLCAVITVYNDINGWQGVWLL